MASELPFHGIPIREACTGCPELTLKTKHFSLFVDRYIDAISHSPETTLAEGMEQRIERIRNGHEERSAIFRQAKAELLEQRLTRMKESGTASKTYGEVAGETLDTLVGIRIDALDLQDQCLQQKEGQCLTPAALAVRAAEQITWHAALRDALNSKEDPPDTDFFSD